MADYHITRETYKTIGKPWQDANGIAEPARCGTEHFQLAMIAGAEGKPSLVAPSYHNQHALLIVDAALRGRDQNWGCTAKELVARFAQERGLKCITETLYSLISYNEQGSQAIDDLFQVAADAVPAKQDTAA